MRTFTFLYDFTDFDERYVRSLNESSNSIMLSKSPIHTRIIYDLRNWSYLYVFYIKFINSIIVYRVHYFYWFIKVRVKKWNYVTNEKKLLRIDTTLVKVVFRVTRKNTVLGRRLEIEIVSKKEYVFQRLRTYQLSVKRQYVKISWKIKF